MVAVGLREGIKTEKNKNEVVTGTENYKNNPDPYTNQHTRILSQLLYFINVITKELEEQNQVLKTVNAEKDKFFYILAHDLRSPLSAFVSATQLITEEIQTMDLADIRDITLSMKTSAANIYNLLENLLEWSLMKRGGVDFSPKTFNLKKKTEVCINVLSESAGKKQIDIIISIPDDIEILADIHMFDTIIRNLVSNAIKFTPAGGKIKVDAEYDKDYNTIIKISDSGIGMTNELKDKLFILNEKTSRSGTEGEPSTGLGLLLCKEFVDKHNGRLWVESEEGKGSAFSFLIPR